jgi:hypothetical protein
MSTRPIALLAAALLLAGCSKPVVDFYRVPHEKDPELPGAAAATPPGEGSAPFAANGAGMAETPVATTSGTGLQWQAPARWKAKPLSAMRKGSFAVAGSAGTNADLSITAFPGDVGGELANVNRWRGQVQLPALTPDDLAGAVTHQTYHGLSFTIVEAKSAGSAQRILGAIVPYGDSTWFFKLMGPDAVVTAAKPEFLAFLQTVAPSAP